MSDINEENIINTELEAIQNTESDLINNYKEYYVYEYYIEESNEVFYVGKGKGNRAWKDVRNPECEKIKAEYEWKVRIVEEGITEDEALSIERDLIEKYRASGVMLTNIMPGGVKPTEKEAIGYVKYLSFLVEKGVLQMSLVDISNLLLLNQSTVWQIVNSEHYTDIDPLLPENINEIIHKYHVNSYTDDQIRVGNIKYILDLIEKDVLKLSQAQLAEYYEVTPSNVSSIKKGKTHANVPLLIPDNVGDIFKRFDVFYVSEEEKIRGMIMFIIRLRNEGILRMTNRDIGRVLEVSDYLVAEFNRTNEDRKYVAKEYRPDAEIMAKLIPYFVVK
ncbi:hypothetical protein GCM10010954_14440 [Halobacillus andaensis]|uniref:GIY-YIG domain-containing protein n=1 Tax=Halobacillus andaensis TaxID=1176239 RepID=A0A917EU86_HALAA|nr:GIY-YIG nuclease family protein [Halobacillus andaensis]MBP2004248.1 transcriptional regulator with XRE-family HTH domain [Halobacillus andaensis]GGF16909.1 hypothetical protein GCM10010954_14440 [Halobacillus andaensis]